jgi:antitoxin (DNA-binding transcriptional repressor) of toxin-antitoxin stability system
MKTTNIRELKHDTTTVLGWVAAGEHVEITRHNEVVGIIVPPNPPKKTSEAMPDFYQRLEELFHDRSQPMTGTELVSYGRGER